MSIAPDRHPGLVCGRLGCNLVGYGELEPEFFGICLILVSVVVCIGCLECVMATELFRQHHIVFSSIVAVTLIGLEIVIDKIHSDTGNDAAQTAVNVV